MSAGWQQKRNKSIEAAFIFLQQKFINMEARSLDKRKQIEKEIYNKQDLFSKSPRWAGLWDDNCMYLIVKEVRDWAKKRAIEYLENKDILILGGGRLETQIIKNIRYRTLYLINISETEIEKSKEYYSEDTIFIVGDAENTGFDNNKFDAIICNSILHHLDIDKALKEIKRILKKGGIVFVAAEPAALNPIAFIRRKFFPSDFHTLYEKPFIINIFRKKLRQYGFKEIEFESFSIFSLAIPVVAKQLKIGKALNLEKPLKLILKFEKKIRNFTVIREFCWIFSAVYKNNS